MGPKHQEADQVDGQRESAEVHCARDNLEGYIDTETRRDAVENVPQKATGVLFLFLLLIFLDETEGASEGRSYVVVHQTLAANRRGPGGADAEIHDGATLRPPPLIRGPHVPPRAPHPPHARVRRGREPRRVRAVGHAIATGVFGLVVDGLRGDLGSRVVCVIGAPPGP